MEADVLRQEIRDLEQKLEDKKDEIDFLERNCKHEWGEDEPAHIYHKEHMSPGDPSGIMGVDRRFDCHVPAHTQKRWKRVCKKCHK
jgi:hypothetical protein